MQGESGDLTDPLIEGLVTRGQRLQRERLAASLRTDGDAVGDRRTQALDQRPGLKVVTSQIAVLRIPFQHAPAFELAADTQRQGLGQSGQLGAGRRLHPAEPQCAVGTLDLHPVEEQHVEVDVERAAEALDQCDRAGLGRPT